MRRHDFCPSYRRELRVPKTDWSLKALRTMPCARNATHSLRLEPFKTIVRSRRSSKLLHPRPHLDLPAPRTSRLLEQMQIAPRDGIRIECRVGLVGRLGAACRADAAVDHHVGDVDALGAELAGHALRQAAQR